MYFSHILAANDQASLHICEVSTEPLKITLQRRVADEGLCEIGQFKNASNLSHMRTANP